jgi:hypothetical protein
MFEMLQLGTDHHMPAPSCKERMKGRGDDNSMNYLRSYALHSDLHGNAVPKIQGGIDELHRIKQGLMSGE